jgi:predicted RNA-binding Zn-ribbon protein involved in translation (DUF1610 family)
MTSRPNRFFRHFLRQSRTINNEPLNKVSVIVIVLIDLFILMNVFVGLDDVSQWHLAPDSAYPCHGEWQAYRQQTIETKDIEMMRRAADPAIVPLGEQYRQAAIDHLGQVSDVCLQYATLHDAIKQPKTSAILQRLSDQQNAISNLESSNATIREQYDSSLLEKIADQPRNQSINTVEAARAKQTLDQNETKIRTLKAEIATLETELLSFPESSKFLTFLQQNSTFLSVDQAYETAIFWYPSLQLAFQASFLMPLLLIAFASYHFAQRSQHGLMALISWHLLVIFVIPLVLKLFEFLQIGVLFEFLFDFIKALFGSLLFLLSYVYIVIIPLIGFGLIKLFQYFIFNPQIQASNRVQKSRCIRCAKKLASHNLYCPHCGYHQYQECNHCHQLTYKYLPHCKECGTAQSTRQL